MTWNIQMRCEFVLIHFCFKNCIPVQTFFILLLLTTTHYNVLSSNICILFRLVWCPDDPFIHDIYTCNVWFGLKL